MNTNNLKRCKDCVHYHTGGIKDGKHNKWCVANGKPAAKSIGHCILHNQRLTNEH